MIDLGTSIASFIVFVEVSIGLTRCDSQRLSRLHLDSHVPGSYLEFFKFREIILRNVIVLSDRDSLE